MLCRLDEFVKGPISGILRVLEIIVELVSARCGQAAGERVLLPGLREIFL